MGKIKEKLKSALFVLNAMLKWKKKIPIVHVKEDGNLLKGKVALITGGSGGIGLAIAKKFIDCGCKVIVAGTNEDKLIAKCKTLGGECKHMVLNVSNVSDFESYIKDAAAMYGQIDILVCSHGIHTGRSHFDFLNVTEHDYDTVMNVNLKGTYFLCQEMAKYMIANKIKGHILIISSHRALEASWSPYRLSKRGLEGITEGIAQRLVPYGIVVNAIGPGPAATAMQDELIEGSIYTPENPIERYTLPEEVAEYAKMMVSELGNTIIGQTLYMSGGAGVVVRN